MGTNVSTSMQSIVNQCAMSASNTVIQSTMNTTRTSQQTNLSITVNNLGTIKCSNFQITQKADANLTANVQFMSQNSSDLGTQISTQFNNLLTSAIQQNNAQLNLGQTNVSSTVSNINNQLSTSISSLVQSTIKNVIDTSQIMNGTIVLNNGIVVVNGTPVTNPNAVLSSGQCVIDQNFVSTVLVTAISDSITTAVMKTQAVADLTSSSQNTTSQTNTGINPLSIVMIIAVVAVIALAIGGYTMFGSGSPIGILMRNKYVIIGIVVLILAGIGVVIYEYVSSKKSSS
jgi:hypothetical protein